MTTHFEILSTPRTLTENKQEMASSSLMTLRMESEANFIRNLHINSPIVQEPRKIHRQHKKIKKPPTREPPSPKSSHSSEVLYLSN